jgi:hypothetical protein
MGAEAPDMGGEDMGAEAPDMGGEDMGAEAPDMGGEDVTFKSIQKLVGKLGQKLRAIGDKEEMTSKDLKYVINSVISAIDLTKLDDEDKEEIMSKFEPEEGDYGVEPEVDVEKDVDIEEPMPTDGESEMKEEESGSLGDKFVKSVGTRMAKGLMNTLKGGEMEEDEKHGLDDIINGLFESSLAESKVDKVLSKYFKISESEKKIIKEKTSNTLSEIKRLSETKKQKEVSEKIYSKVPTIKLIGKTNKKNLVFEHKNKQIKVSPEGRVL